MPGKQLKYNENPNRPGRPPEQNQFEVDKAAC